MSTDKIARIVGLSSSVLFDKDNPRNPINRRISIIVMTQQAEEAAEKSDAVAPPGAADAPAAAPAAAAAAAAAGPAATIASATTGPIERPAPVAH